MHHADHPPADLAEGTYRVSMPASIEAFVHARLPQAERVELCHADGRVVIHRGWSAIPDGCLAVGDDRVVALD